jgi:GAF domain-containing protein
MPLEGSSTGAAIAQRQPLHFPDLADKAGLPEDKRAALQQTGGMTVLYAPMISQDRGVGSLVVTRRPKKPFTRTEIDLIQTFADQAVIAIENARLFEQVQTKTRNLEESLQQQTATAEVLKVISRSAFDLQVVFDTLVQSAARLCEAESAFIFQHDGEVYRLKSSVGFQPGFRDFMARHPIEVGRGTLVGRTALTRDIVHIPDVLTDPDYAWSESRQLGGYRTMLGVPLLRGGIPVGVLAMTRDQPRPFTSKQVELVQTFADQAVIAIENARLFDEVQARTRDLGEALEQQTATADVLKIISRSAFDLQAVLDTLTTSAVNLLGMRSGTICVRDGGVFRYRSAAGAFWTEELWRYLQDHPVVPGRSTAAGRAILSGHIEQIPDILDDAEYGIPMQALTSEQFPRAMLSVPLLGKDRIEGAMVLSRQHPGPFTQREVDILQTFADQAVIAIDNTRLFNETREALERQTATADILKVIASSPSNAQPVFEAIASSANRLIGGFSTAVHLIVNDMVHLVAFTPTNPEADAILVAAHPRHRSEVPAVALVENGEIAQIADSETADAHIRQIGRARGWRSVTLTPLMNRRNFIGFMASTRRETGVLGNHQVELLRTFSDQAVIAIENARLFNELQARTRDLSRSLDDLRTAQDRLVQTEKLASLGQLTAGIAHEIKNPLNFINNFAALSVELTDELLDVLKPAPLDAMMRGDVDELTHMLKGNLDKVTQHGRRADSIVRNMLLHSREGTGEHRPADINALVEESLNLAYHGARAEKPGFNITLQRAFDPAAGEIELFPQEITRVLLNLITNGFYATARRKAEAGDGFEPVLSAATRTLGDRVEIRIRDNGTGIPPEVREKIFNPFFTTKPAGEGTGLGLSMSHDIIVKQHGGTIDVETEPGAFTEFIVTLPRAGAAAPETGGLK